MEGRNTMKKTERARRIRWWQVALLLAGLGMVAAACGDSGSDNSAGGDSDTPTTAAQTTEAPTTAAPTTEAPTTEAPTTSEAAPDFGLADFNGDGKVVIGVAVPGPRDDGAYYQALVNKVEQISADNGYESPIVVDNIDSADAATELANLAEQGVDIIALGASEIADPLADVSAQFPDIFWYCNCGAGYPEGDTYAQSQDDGSEISYSAGAATGILLADSGGDSTVFIGCCDLGFEKESYMAFELGLQSIDPSFTMTYVPVGNFPFDFDNTAGATEAFNTAVADGVDAVYPFLGGAHEPVVKLANENDVIVMSAGASDVCERTDLDWDIAVRFDAGDYLDTIFKEILSGDFTEGSVRVFHVGVDPEPGAVICDATPEQQAALDEVYAEIASGDLNDAFFAIKKEAYGF